MLNVSSFYVTFNLRMTNFLVINDTYRVITIKLKYASVYPSLKNYPRNYNHIINDGRCPGITLCDVMTVVMLWYSFRIPCQGKGTNKWTSAQESISRIVTI